MSTDELDDSDASALRAEVARLRRLVGPNETSYAEAQAEIGRARDAAREAEAELGVLRGELTELRYTLHRAVQDQHHIRRTVLSPALKLRHRMRTLRRQP